MKSFLPSFLVAAVAVLSLSPSRATAAPLKVLLIDGQNNHAWQQTSPELKTILEENGLARVDVATSPAKGASVEAFEPNFAAYQVVVSNYNGALWSEKARSEFEKYVSN